MDRNDFLPIERDMNIRESSFIVRPNWWQRFKLNRLAVVGAGIIAVMIVLAIFGPMISPYTYADQSLVDANQSPSLAHWFGTDTLGRDIYTRVMYGARISLTIGIVAALLNLVIGVIYGGIAGYFGGKTDRIMMAIVDVLYGIPLLLYVILLMVVIGPGLTSIFIALGIAYWLNMARIVRSQIVKVREEEYIIAAETMGIPKWRILWRHILPNCVGPIIITLTLAIPDAIFTEAFLSFVGLGIPVPQCSLGSLISETFNSFTTHPYQIVPPIVVMSLLMLCFNMLADGLREAFDPKLKEM